MLLSRSPQFATRATLLCTEALKSKNLYAEAAMQFIKMTSEVRTDYIHISMYSIAQHGPMSQQAQCQSRPIVPAGPMSQQAPCPSRPHVPAGPMSQQAPCPSRPMSQHGPCPSMAHVPAGPMSQQAPCPSRPMSQHGDAQAW
jgi:hypothetical protein